MYLTYANHEPTRSTYPTNQRNPLNIEDSKYGGDNNEDTRKTKLIKTAERRQLRPSGVFIFNFEHTSCLCLVFLLITFFWVYAIKVFFLFHP